MTINCLLTWHLLKTEVILRDKLCSYMRLLICWGGLIYKCSFSDKDQKHEFTAMIFLDGIFVPGV